MPSISSSTRPGFGRGVVVSSGAPPDSARSAGGGTHRIALGRLRGLWHSHLGWMMNSRMTNTVTFGKDLLRLKFDKDATSYWIRRSNDGPAGSMKDQF